MKRRAAAEPVIGHRKGGHRMERNYLAHKQGDAINPILAAAGYNFRLILKWIRLLWFYFCYARENIQPAKTTWFTDDFSCNDGPGRTRAAIAYSP